MLAPERWWLPDPACLYCGGSDPRPPCSHGPPWPYSSTGAFCIPLYVPYVLTGRWPFGRGLCKLWLVMDYLLCTSSVFNIVLISYDRFLSVTRAVSLGWGCPCSLLWEVVRSGHWRHWAGGTTSELWAMPGGLGPRQPHA